MNRNVRAKTPGQTSGIQATRADCAGPGFRLPAVAFVKTAMLLIAVAFRAARKNLVAVPARQMTASALTPSRFSDYSEP